MFEQSSDLHGLHLHPKNLGFESPGLLVPDITLGLTSFYNPTHPPPPPPTPETAEQFNRTHKETAKQGKKQLQKMDQGVH